MDKREDSGLRGGCSFLADSALAIVQSRREFFLASSRAIYQDLLWPGIFLSFLPPA